jgi:hypoxanthine phosphoribosyltransferase
VCCEEGRFSILIKAEYMGNVELLISRDAIEDRILDVARALDVQYEGEELTIVMVMKGALCITADLIRALKIPCTIEAVKASSYGERGAKRGELQILGLEEVNLFSKNVLIVDDIFDSGQTLLQIFSKLKEKNPKSLKSLVLLEKNVDREISYLPDYILFSIENLFVIGYGLDYKEHYRGLPGIYYFSGE